MYFEFKNIFQQLKKIKIQEQDVEVHIQGMVKVLDVPWIENHGNNKSGGVGLSASDGFLLNRRVKSLENRALLSSKSL